MSIYVEIKIRVSIDDLWTKTQSPTLHEQWDLRFTEIKYLPRNDNSEPQRFLYSTRIGFGLYIRGEGESTGNREGETGQRTSALRFWSKDPKSLIREGSGYWKYIPTEDGIRFLTWYNYTTCFRAFGRAFDAAIFRPIMGWASAWSFDRLRLWIEKGIDPALTLERSLVYSVSRIAIAFVWFYQGAIPKLIFRHGDELVMLRDAGISASTALPVLKFVGWGEVVFGLVFLAAWTKRSLLLANIALMLCATVVVAMNSPGHLVAAFNPVALNTAMIALSLAGFLSGKNLASARRCLRKRPENEA
jgi:DoxX-like family